MSITLLSVATPISHEQLARTKDPTHTKKYDLYVPSKAIDYLELHDPAVVAAVFTEPADAAKWNAGSDVVMGHADIYGTRWKVTNVTASLCADLIGALVNGGNNMLFNPPATRDERTDLFASFTAALLAQAGQTHNNLCAKQPFPKGGASWRSVVDDQGRGAFPIYWSGPWAQVMLETAAWKATGAV